MEVERVIYTTRRNTQAKGYNFIVAKINNLNM